MSFRSLIALSVLIAGSIVAAQTQEVFTHKVGKFEVSVLVERSGPRNPDILIDVSEAHKNMYFPSGSIPFQMNAFLVKTPDRAILVDTGLGINLLANLKTLGVDPAKIEAVLITHMHGDHFGGLETDGKANFPNATVYLAEREKNYWLPAGGNPLNDGAAKALAAYGANVRTFNPSDITSRGQDLFPGITPIASYGHTPGHTVFLIHSEGERLLIMGDLFHAQIIQFPVPDITVTFDVDPATAREARKKVFDYAARNRIPITGMHSVSPVFGLLQAQANGGYSFKAIE